MTSGSVSHKITFSGTVFLAYPRGDLLTQVRMIERYQFMVLTQSVKCDACLFS